MQVTTQDSLQHSLHTAGYNMPSEHHTTSSRGRKQLSRGSHPPAAATAVTSEATTRSMLADLLRLMELLYDFVPPRERLAYPKWPAVANAANTRVPLSKSSCTAVAFNQHDMEPFGERKSVVPQSVCRWGKLPSAATSTSVNWPVLLTSMGQLIVTSAWHMKRNRQRVNFCEASLTVAPRTVR